MKRTVLPIFIVLLMSTSAWCSELKFNYIDEAGRPVDNVKGEMLFVSWGDAARLDLGTLDNPAVIPFEDDWLKNRKPEDFISWHWNQGYPHDTADFLGNVDWIYFFFLAEGYAPIRSDKVMCWPGIRAYDKKSSEMKSCEVRFPGRKPLVVQDGDSVEMSIVFRRPGDRTVRFISDNGDAAAGIRASIYSFWSASNHCGRMSGADLLSVETSDADGRIQVPDGDIEYAIVIDDDQRGVVYINPESPSYPRRLITTLTDSETTVRLHLRNTRTLLLQAKNNEGPAAGADLMGCVADYPCGTCGACCGILSHADENGMIRIDDFMPEAYSVIFFGPDQLDAQWKAVPAELPDGIIKVDLTPR